MNDSLTTESSVSAVWGTNIPYFSTKSWPMLCEHHDSNEILSPAHKRPGIHKCEYRVFVHVKRFRIIKVCKLCISSHYPSTKTAQKCAKSTAFHRESSENQGAERVISACRPYRNTLASPILKCSITNERLARAGYYSLSGRFESLHSCDWTAV